MTFSIAPPLRNWLNRLIKATGGRINNKAGGINLRPANLPPRAFHRRMVMINEEMTALEVDEMLDRYAAIEREITASEQKRDSFIARYQEKIAAAQKICEDETKSARAEMALIEEQLKRYAEVNLPEGKKSIALPSGTLSFRKQSPRFFFDDLKEANGKDERMIQFVRDNATQYLNFKVEESVDWAKFKSRLETSENGDVYFADTGELIEGLHAQFLPDKFTVKLT